MTSQPEKWEKYRLLFKYNLASEDDINAQIKRYNRQQKDQVFTDILDDMKQSLSEATYVIKLVPKELRLKLTNFSLQDQSQLLKTISSLSSNTENYVEVWWCKTAISQGSGIHGRFYINSGGTTDVSQCIEQVWAGTARKIEKIGDGTPFLFARRLWWGRNYQIQNGNLASINPSIALKHFYDIARQIEEKRYEFEQLSQDAFHLNINSLCMEYKLIDGKVYVVDWDSPDDKLLLGKLL